MPDGLMAGRMPPGLQAELLRQQEREVKRVKQELAVDQASGITVPGRQWNGDQARQWPVPAHSVIAFPAHRRHGGRRPASARGGRWRGGRLRCAASWLRSGTRRLLRWWRGWRRMHWARRHSCRQANGGACVCNLLHGSWRAGSSVHACGPRGMPSLLCACGAC